VTLVLAHRGYTGSAGENTLAAFADARRLGADGVELDVRRSADGALVVHHDAVIADAGPVAELTARELPSHVPLLPDALAVCEGMVVNVEIKNSPGDAGYDPDEAVSVATAATIVECGWAEGVIVSSFNAPSIDAVRNAEPRLAVGWLLGLAADPAASVVRAAGAGYQALHPFVSQVTGALVAQAHDAGLTVNVWTVNPDQALREMVAFGVDAVITDRLEEALVIVGEG
jgi:glycerophosphoryl diester phosphodiesterase